MRPLLLFGAVFLLTSGCRYPVCSNSTPLPRPRISQAANLSETEVVTIAGRVVEQNGEHLADYRSPIVNFDSSTGEWWLWFHRKPPEPPGGHFGVCIKDATKDARFIPGE